MGMLVMARDQRDLAVLSDLAPDIAALQVSVGSDIAMVIDAEGLIRQVALGGSEPIRTLADEWMGRPFADTVTEETRRKVEQLLADAVSTGVSRSRQVNHPSRLGIDIPIAYSAVRLGHEGPILVVGRDMSVVSALQQRLLHAQQEMERDYWQRRQSETRYQLLFQIATDAVMVIDSTSFNVVDANRAAARLFGLPLDEIIGKRATLPLHEHSRGDINDLFMAARLSGRAAEAEALLPGHRGAVHVSITPLRTEANTSLLMRVRPLDPEWQVPQAGARLMSLMRISPDAIVITDSSGRIQMSNPAFLRLAELSPALKVLGQPLSNWLCITAGDFERLLQTLRRESSTRQMLTAMRRFDGLRIAVEVSAACQHDGDEESFGFIVRLAQGSAGMMLTQTEAPDQSLH